MTNTCSNDFLGLLARICDQAQRVPRVSHSHVVMKDSKLMFYKIFRKCLSSYNPVEAKKEELRVVTLTEVSFHH